MPSSPDDYYALLGVDAGADSATLRRAWRRLALRWHPDRAGPDATATFQRISVAYTVLSDAAARAVYDRRRRIAGAKGGEGERGPAPAPGAQRDAQAGEGAPRAAPLRRAPAVMLQRVSGPLNALIACGVARRVGEGLIDLFLDADEIAEGGMVMVSMPVPVRCTACAADPERSCGRCGSKRTVDELFSAWLAVRPGATDCTALKPSAMLPGMDPVVFRVRYRDLR